MAGKGGGGGGGGGVVGPIATSSYLNHRQKFDVTSGMKIDLHVERLVSARC